MDLKPISSEIKSQDTDNIHITYDWKLEIKQL